MNGLYQSAILATIIAAAMLWMLVRIRDEERKNERLIKMAREKFKLKFVEILPVLKPEEVENLIKFMCWNAEALSEISEFDSCCATDDASSVLGFAADALRLGYGLEDLDEYLSEHAEGEDE